MVAAANRKSRTKMIEKFKNLFYHIKHSILGGPFTARPLKLPGMASDFYRTQVARHLLIGVRAMERIRDMPLERIHSRKLRSFEETAFL